MLSATAPQHVLTIIPLQRTTSQLQGARSVGHIADRSVHPAKPGPAVRFPALCTLRCSRSMLSLCGTRLRVAEHRLDGLGDGVMPMVSARACVACVWPRDIDGGSKPCMHDGGAGGAAPPWGRRSSPSYGPRSGKIWGFDWSRGQFHEKTSTTILQSHRPN